MPRLALLLAAIVVALPAQAAQVSGRVHDGGRGIAGVLVSNGQALARTDAQGRYRLDVAEGQTVFVVKPPQCALPVGEDGLPAFWRHHAPRGIPAARYGGLPPTGPAGEDWDFALDCGVPAAQAPFDVLVFGDPQVGSPTEIDYYRRDIVEPLLAQGHTRDARFGLTLGDLVADELDLYPPLNAVTAGMGLPWLHAAGNHDLDFDADHDRGSLATFRRTYGPDTFAYEDGPLRLVVLDSTVYLPGQTPAYVGGLREDQFAFLEAYLATVQARDLVVLAMHVPLFTPEEAAGETFRDADRQRLFRLLEPLPNVLVLSAHRHAQRHVFHAEAAGWRGGAPLHEYNVGAAAGGFWGGVPDAEGIPSALMADGTPNGYARLRVLPDGGYALYWHAARADGDPAIALHAPRVLRRGAYPGVSVYANVFMGIDGDRVEMRIGDGDWAAMRRVDEPDPRVVAVNLADDAAPRLCGHDRTPQATVSTHLWRGRLPTDLAAGEHRIEVRAFDRWRGEVRAQTRYRLEAVAAP